MCTLAVLDYGGYRQVCRGRGESDLIFLGYSMFYLLDGSWYVQCIFSGVNSKRYTGTSYLFYTF